MRRSSSRNRNSDAPNAPPPTELPEGAAGASAARRGRAVGWRLMLRATLFGDCPNCLFGSQFDGPLRARRSCALCGMGFEPNDDGSNALGAAYLVLTVVPIVLIAEGVLLARSYGLFSGFGVVMALSAVLLIALSYRPARGWWVWCQWTFGFLDTTRDLELRGDGAAPGGRRAG